MNSVISSSDIRPITPPEEKERNKLRVPSELKVTLANTELLLKLFDGVDGRKTTCRLKRGRSVNVINYSIVTDCHHTLTISQHHPGQIPYKQ